MLVRAHNSAFALTERLLADWLLGTLARLTFAGVLLMFFLNSAQTKVGEGVSGLLNLDIGAFVQILPQRFEEVGFDPSALTQFERFVVYAGTWAEIILPILIVVGLFTRISALGMIVFVAVMTYTDIVAHGVDEAAIGAWFDAGAPDASIWDHRSLWIFLLIVLALKGPGPFSLDAVFGRLGWR